MKAHQHDTPWCCSALSCLMSIALLIGCNTDNGVDSPVSTKKPVIVITDRKPAEEAIFLETNAVREKYGKTRLTQDARLRELARDYSELMLKHNFFGHVTPDGVTLSDRFERFKISYHAIAENLARYEGAFQTIPTREVVEGWLNSPGHRINLLDEKNYGFTHIGIGIAIGKSPSTSQPVYYYTQLFWLP